MEELQKAYIDRIDLIKNEIQESEILTRYLDEEDIEIYKELQLEFEPKIDEVHVDVAQAHPLQLEQFEQQLLDPAYEGLYLPRILGYAVVRGQINDNFKYIRPQNHFKEVLDAICTSANFDSIRTRIGQTVQVGFALSSDIWITNLMAAISNKKIVAFLESLRSDKFRDIRDRRTAYVRYLKQFQNYNYLSAEFPQTIGELKVFGQGLKNFFVYRSKVSEKNESLYPFIKDFLTNDEFIGEKEFFELVMVILMYMNADQSVNANAKNRFESFRSREDGQDTFFHFLNQFQTDPAMQYTAVEESSISSVIDLNKNDEISRYFNLTNEIHTKGYVNDEVIEKVKAYYDQHEGLSMQNKCIRNIIKDYITKFISNLQESEYEAFFDIYKTIISYMNVFSNEKFNQDVKTVSLIYIKKLIKHYPDKRGKDYQDVKKFVSTTFNDLGFLSEKEIVEFFKTRRKKKTA